jgi:hypothetical protein
MDQAARERVQRELEDEANQRFPGAAAQIRLLEHGDDPVVEPGEVLIRISLAPEDSPDGPEQASHAFEQAQGPELSQFRRELLDRVPEARRILVIREDPGGQDHRRFIMRLNPDDPGTAGERRAGKDELTPVMARLGPADLETVDTLITAGIAANRADAVRWALARIRERPAYAQLRERTREIERLKTEF